MTQDCPPPPPYQHPAYQKTKCPSGNADFCDTFPYRDQAKSRCGPSNSSGNVNNLRQPPADFCISDSLAEAHHHHQQQQGDHYHRHGGHYHHHDAQHHDLDQGHFHRHGDHFHKHSGGHEQNQQLKKKLEECIKKFDSGAPDTMNNLNTIKDYLSNKITDEECFPRYESVGCPVSEAPGPYEVPHPYLPGMTMFAKPFHTNTQVKVTSDGRYAELPRPTRYYREQPPMNVPPWVLPRYKSQELRGGLLLKGCHCWKKNGLQDDCPRWDCSGRPECKIRPLPSCPPAMNAPVCGIRKPNLYHGKPPTCRRAAPPPYPVQDFSKEKCIPMAPADPCPVHQDM